MSVVAVPWARDIRTCRQNNSSCDSQLGRGVLSRMRALHGEIWRAKMWETGKHESASGSHAHTHNARAPLIRDTESRPSMRKNIGIKNMSWISWVRRTSAVRAQTWREWGNAECCFREVRRLAPRWSFTSLPDTLIQLWIEIPYRCACVCWLWYKIIRAHEVCLNGLNRK